MGNCVGNGMHQYQIEKISCRMYPNDEMQIGLDDNNFPNYFSRENRHYRLSNAAKYNACLLLRRGRSSVHPLHVRGNPDECGNNEAKVVMSNCSRSSSSQRKKPMSFKHLSPQRHGGHVKRIKVLVSAKQLSEIISQGHTKDSIASVLLANLQTCGAVNVVRVRASCQGRDQSWRPSLEDIPEVLNEAECT